MALVFAGLVGGVVGLVGYQLGLFDRPKFHYGTSLLTSNEKQTYLYCVVALSTEKSIGKHIERLMSGVMEGIRKSMPDYEERLRAAAKLYSADDDVGDTSTMLSVGLYFDNPNTEAQPRWASGWAVQGDSIGDESYYEQLLGYVRDIQTNSGLDVNDNTIRIVRVGRGGTTVLKGRIPVRTRFSPMIAPMIQWTRAYTAMKEGGYEATHNSRKDRCQSPALEVYFVDPKHCVSKMDYVVLMGDVTTTWDDCYPPTK